MAGITTHYRQTERDTVAAAGMIQAGNVSDLEHGRLDIAGSYLYVETGGARLVPIVGVRPDGWVATGARWATQSYYCAGADPIYRKP